MLANFANVRIRYSRIRNNSHFALVTVKIILERSKCIGCGSCTAVCPQLFELAEDGKSHLKNSQKDNQEIETLEISEPSCTKEAADVCPVQIIKIQ